MKLTSDAERGSLSAEIELGARYMTGDGVPRDPTAAAHWYEKAAQRGEPNAQNQIGYFYQSGIGVPKDLSRAMHWYQLSAASGDASAIVNIGVLYVIGMVGRLVQSSGELAELSNSAVQQQFVQPDSTQPGQKMRLAVLSGPVLEPAASN